MMTACVKRQRMTVMVVTAAVMLVACKERSVEIRQDAGEGMESSQPPQNLVEPALIFASPADLQTNRGVDNPVQLGFHGVPEGYPVMEERMPADWAARLKRILRFTDVDTETDLPYGLEKKLGRPEKIHVKPDKSIETGKGYRVSLDLSKGGSPFPGVKVLDQYLSEVANREASVEFYTYSRPMLFYVDYYESTENGWRLVFEFTEALRVEELLGNTRARLLVDGVDVEGCTDPYEQNCFDHPIGHGPYEHEGQMIELTGGIHFSIPSGLGAFTEIALRMPHAVLGLRASLLDGAPHNRVATVDGDDIVYAIKFSDMHEMRPGRWMWKY